MLVLSTVCSQKRDSEIYWSASQRDLRKIMCKVLLMVGLSP